MQNLQQIINDSKVIYSKQQILDYVKEHQIYFPTNLESKLLKWNSKPLIKYESDQLEVSLGVFFCQVIKLSQQQSVSQDYSYFQNKNQQLNDINQNQYIKLCHHFFPNTLQGFPQNINNSKIFDQQLFQCFALEKHLIGEHPQQFQNRQYISLKNQSEEKLNYKILVYQSPHQYGSQVHIIFSTNNDIDILTNKIFSNIPPLTQNQGKPYSTIQPYVNKSNSNTQYKDSECQKYTIRAGNGSQTLLGLGIPSNPINQIQKNHQINRNFSSINLAQKQQLKKQEQEQFQINMKSQPIKGNITSTNNFSDNYNNCLETPKIMDTEIEKQENQQINKKLFSSTIQPRKNEPKKKCDKCQIEFVLNFDQSIQTPCCNEKVHSQCLQTYLDEKAKENMNFENLPCFACEKQLKDYEDFLKHNISKELYDSIIKRRFFSNVSLGHSLRESCPDYQQLKQFQQDKSII
ncbi:unnamed protein product [Paramecium pentaurelia]|uniref:Uncharacterized protein n=1 Tax=Paramecium pentaurelia TaxID=43138 RepID=A0A8S1V931_9CILI|nr:unnamed protein product [Paramecium pentaurelia]